MQDRISNASFGGFHVAVEDETKKGLVTIAIRAEREQRIGEIWSPALIWVPKLTQLF